MAFGGERPAAAQASLTRLVLVSALAALACNRALPVAAADRDAGADRTLSDAGSDRPGLDAGAEAGRDAAPDGPATCPVGVGPVDVCGCGCCGSPQTSTCYYPAEGESAASIPNPVPSNCANAGCSSGVRHLCCADPGPGPAPDMCAEDRSGEDLPRYVLIRRDGTVCTRLEIWESAPAQLPISGPSGWRAQFGYRGPCDGSSPAAPVIGAAGTLNVYPSNAAATVDVVDIHAALFFDDGGGIATAVRLDADGLVVSSTPCPYGTP